MCLNQTHTGISSRTAKKRYIWNAPCDCTQHFLPGMFLLLKSPFCKIYACILYVDTCVIVISFPSFFPAYPDAFSASEYYWEQVPRVYQVLHEENVPFVRPVPQVGCGGACFSKYHSGLTFASRPAAVNWHWRKMDLLFYCSWPFFLCKQYQTSLVFTIYPTFLLFNSSVFISVQFCLCAISFAGIMVLYYKNNLRWSNSHTDWRACTFFSTNKF